MNLMMDPFSENYWSSPRSRMAVNRQSTSPLTKTSKIVSIPVHFIGSNSTSTAALKIQKVFRGFLVRKSMKKIIGIKREVDEIEKRISQKETVDLIRRDLKEKLKVNEMLMVLLFRLDSIQGVGSGVRDCRKSVIRKTIMLQERVDSIAAGDERVDSIAAGDETVELMNDEETKNQGHEIGDCVVDSSDNNEVLVGVVEQLIGNKDPVDSSENCEKFGNVVMDVDDHEKRDHNSGDYEGFQGSVVSDECHPMIESPEKSHSSAKYEGNLETNEGNGCSELAECVKGENWMESVEEGEEKTAKKEEKENVMEIQESEPELIQVNEEGDNIAVGDGEKRHDSKDMMVRMIEENEKLTGLVAKLCERNELQTQLIHSLSRRMENLEKAFKSEKLRRKNKRMDATTDSAKLGRKS